MPSTRRSNKLLPARLVLALGLSVQLLQGCSSRPVGVQSDDAGPASGARSASVASQKSSAYLEAHGKDLVHWQPWSEASFGQARKEDKPVFLSIGFAACHWCHVMQKESFNDGPTAAYLNEHFINILVDREARPDIDARYSAQLMALGGRQGWPMTLFLRPDQTAFYAGTYYSAGDEKTPHSLRQIAAQNLQLWRQNRRAVDSACAKVQRVTHLSEALNQVGADSLPHSGVSSVNQSKKLDENLPALKQANLDFAIERLLKSCDPEFGGLQQSRKYPLPQLTSLMIACSLPPSAAQANARAAVNSMATTLPFRCLALYNNTLNQMASSQICDQIDGGFFRYATTNRWMRPHFEKMLSDNALIARLYFNAYHATKNKFWLRKGTRTIDFVLRDLLLPNGLFAGSLDADSNGGEGGYYLFSQDEIDHAVPATIVAAVNQACHFIPFGNCIDGKNLPYFDCPDAVGASNYVIPSEVAIGLDKLAGLRAQRTKPSRNENVISAWNGMAVSALLSAYQATNNKRYLKAAEKAINVICTDLVSAGKIKHGTGNTVGFLDDYAFIERAMLDYYALTGNIEWLTRARSVNATVLADFLDPITGKFFYISTDQVQAGKNFYATADGTVPAAAATAIENLLRLSRMEEKPAGRSRLFTIADRSVRASGRAMQQDPINHLSLLCVLEQFLRQPAAF